MNNESILNPSMICPLIFRWKFGLKTVWFLGFSLIILLIGSYVFQISYITRASFSVANYEKQIAGLNREFRALQLNFSDTNSLSGIEEVLIAKGYEKVGKIHYIQVLESAVAAK